MSGHASHRATVMVPALGCLVAAALFGASTPVAKALLESVGPFTLAGLLYLGGAIGVLPFSFRGGSPALRRDPRQRGMLALAVLFGGGIGPVLLLFGLRAGAVNLALGLALEGGLPPLAATLAALAVGAFSYGLSIMLYISGAQQLGASRSQLVFSTSPFLGVLLAWLMFREPATPAQFGAAALMAAGIALMLTSRHEHAHERMTHTHEHRHDDGHHTHVHRGLPAWVRHTHAHEHEPLLHAHPHAPDLHHRHEH